jgi:hypothetical protein
MHEVIRYCFEYQLLNAQARENSLRPGQLERLQALSRLLADPADGNRSYDRMTLRCAGVLELPTGPEPVCVLDIGAGGASVVVSSGAKVPEFEKLVIVIPDIKRGTDYRFGSRVTRVEEDPSGRRIGLEFIGKPTMARRPGVQSSQTVPQAGQSGIHQRHEDSVPRIDLRTFQRTPREGLEEVLTPANGTPAAAAVGDRSGPRPLPPLPPPVRGR